MQLLPGHAHLTGGRGPGLLLLIALAVYTSKNAWKPEVFFSWSYFFGWLALPFLFIAGNQHEGKRVETTPLEDSPPQKLPSHLFFAAKSTITSSDFPAPALQDTRSLAPRQARSSAPWPTFLPRALYSLPARLLLSACRHDLAEHRSHQRIPGMPMNAACLGQNKGMAFSLAPACFSAERRDRSLETTETRIKWLVES